MKSKHVQSRLAGFKAAEPSGRLDERVRSAVDGKTEIVALPRPRRMAMAAAMAAALVLCAGLAAVLLQTASRDAIVWAEVREAHMLRLKQAERVHVRKEIYSTDNRTDYGEVVTVSEIWADRNGLLREESVSTIDQELLDKNYWALPRHITHLFNETGEWKIDHTGKRWAMRPADTPIDIRGGKTAAQVAQERIEYLTTTEFQLPYDDMGEGVFQGQVDSEHGTADVYLFQSADGHWLRCWVTEASDKLLRVERGDGNLDQPTIVYDDIDYDPDFADGLFEWQSSPEYTDGTLIGLEGQPEVINPGRVRVERDAHSVKFFRLQPDGTTSGRPALHVHFDPETSTLRLKGSDYTDLTEDGSPAYHWGATGGASVLGNHYYGVPCTTCSDDPPTRHLSIINDMEYDGMVTPVVELIDYGKEVRHCKVAYDADRDGQYDAWAEIEAYPIED